MQEQFLNPWHPITDSVQLKFLGKLLEELGELTAATSRCLIQGIAEREPVTGKLNKEWLEDEIADVVANIELCGEKFNLDLKRVVERKEEKKLRLATWHRMA